MPRIRDPFAHAKFTLLEDHKTTKVPILGQNHPKHKQFEALSEPNLSFNFHLQDCYIACARWGKRPQWSHSVAQALGHSNFQPPNSPIHIRNRRRSSHLIALNELYSLPKIQLNTPPTAGAAARKLLQHSPKSPQSNFRRRNPGPSPITCLPHPNLSKDTNKTLTSSHSKSHQRLLPHLI